MLLQACPAVQDRALSAVDLEIGKGAKTSADSRCYRGYLYFNGYVSSRLINSYNANAIPNGVFGLPANYHPAESPVNPWPKGGLPTDPGAALWDTNNVNIRLKDGSTVQVAVDTGLHPWRQQYRLGPFNWTVDSSLLKGLGELTGLT